MILVLVVVVLTTIIDLQDQEEGVAEVVLVHSVQVELVAVGIINPLIILITIIEEKHIIHSDHSEEGVGIVVEDLMIVEAAEVLIGGDTVEGSMINIIVQDNFLKQIVLGEEGGEIIIIHFYRGVLRVQYLQDIEVLNHKRIIT